MAKTRQHQAAVAPEEEAIPPAPAAVAEEAAQETDSEETAPALEEGTIQYKGKTYRYNDHLSHFLFLGVDTTGDIQTERAPVYAGQSDTILLLSYDRKEKTLQALAIPRDTMTPVVFYNTKGEPVETRVSYLAIQYAFGDGRQKSCELTRDAVSHLLYGLPIRHYAAINLDAMPLLAETLDGVELVVPDDSLEEVLPAFQKGSTVLLTAENTEQFLRYRDHAKEGQALVRTERQKSFVKAFADKLKRLQKADAGTVTRVFETLKPNMVTNMGNDLFVDLAEASFDGGIQTIPGEQVPTETYDEYRVDEDRLYALLIERFYHEVEQET